MTNFIFKSQWTYKKLCQQLDIIQAEQRHARSDMAIILRYFNKYLTDVKLQKQVDEYFEDETSPQTDSENKPEELDD